MRLLRKKKTSYAPGKVINEVTVLGSHGAETLSCGKQVLNTDVDTEPGAIERDSINVVTKF